MKGDLEVFKFQKTSMSTVRMVQAFFVLFSIACIFAIVYGVIRLKKINDNTKAQDKINEAKFISNVERELENKPISMEKKEINYNMPTQQKENINLTSPQKDTENDVEQEEDVSKFRLKDFFE